MRGFDPDGPSFVVRSTILPIVGLAGRPAPEAIRAAVAAMPSIPHAPAEVLVPPDEADRVATLLPGWQRLPAILHTLPPSVSGPAPSGQPAVPSDPEIRLLAPHEASLLDGFPGDLAADLSLALPWFPTAAAFVDGMPVSFCYAGSPTESLWDVSIETLEPHRRRGLAAKCVRFLIARMRRFGKEPVWGAFDSNEGSLGLAAHLGFRPVDSLTVFYAPEA